MSERRQELDLVAELESARLLRAGWHANAFRYTESDRAYQEAFQRAGINPTLEPEEVARRIWSSGIASRLVTAIDDWAWVKDMLHRGSGEPLLAVARLADSDPWRQQLRHPKVRNNRKALERLAGQQAALAQPLASLELLSRGLVAAHAQESAVQLLRRVQRRYPADFWINYDLAALLAREPATAVEAIGFYRAALAVRPRSYAILNDLGMALRDQGKLAEAVDTFHQAIDLQPNTAKAYGQLGRALTKQGKLAEAIDSYRKEIELQPDNPVPHLNLGVALHEKGSVDQATAEFRKAIGLKKDYAAAHHNLGATLMGKGLLDEAIAEFREAIRLKKDYAEAHHHLGRALRLKGLLDQAMAECREAFRLKKCYAEAHWDLGCMLEQTGQFAAALVHLRRGHELGSKNPHWPSSSAQWVRQCERLVELDGKLPRALKGELQPADGSECLGLAQLCQMPCKSLYGTAVRFYTDAFTAQPHLANTVQGQFRYKAARAAALAGYGQGKDAAGLSTNDRARLRQQALEWLRADLDAWNAEMKRAPDKVRPVVVPQLQHWQSDTDFAGMRGDALSRLGAAERQAWQKLWADVAETLARAKGQVASETSAGPDSRVKGK
jgi:tetratricopeptide (TPR) repeat protein